MNSTNILNAAVLQILHERHIPVMLVTVVKFTCEDEAASWMRQIASGQRFLDIDLEINPRGSVVYPCLRS